MPVAMNLLKQGLRQASRAMTMWGLKVSKLQSLGECSVTRSITSTRSVIGGFGSVLSRNSALVRSMSTVPISAGTKLEQLALDSPYVDVLRYEHKNIKYNLKNLDYHSMSLAVGLLESGLAPGDAVLSWLPPHFSELHVLQFACSKAGFILYNLDPYLAVLDTTTAKEALHKALELSDATALISMEAGNDVNYIRLIEQVVPETRIFNFDDGMPFFTPRFPNLRLPIHLGFDYADKPGMIPMYDIICPTENLPASLEGEVMIGATPLRGEFVLDSKGVPSALGKVMTNDEVVESGVWPEFSIALAKEYREVEGVGNVN